ncbi:MAG: putative protein-methionine-sulfoxide reductase subunit YedZ1 [Chroococcopsis gigantea SAG 12.99]|jgi:thiosulfate reductase cytochrome b subunit|nr:putative protein-methionine-sulfoxide reductase subunit YedZ1 [Chroococcopsis gigantea SAG 12.99]
MPNEISSRTAKSPLEPKQDKGAKLFHWLNLIALTLMMGSGLQIYNANPVFGGREGWHIPPIFLLGGWLAGGRHWHFTAMWLFSFNLLGYGIYIFLTRRWRHRFVSEKDLTALQKSRNVKRKVYAWHRLAYTVVIPILILSIFTGLAMYKPVQFDWIFHIFGSWQILRIVHFIAIPTFLIFMLIHSLLGLKVGGSRLIKSIFY